MSPIARKMPTSMANVSITTRNQVAKTQTEFDGFEKVAYIEAMNKVNVNKKRTDKVKSIMGGFVRIEDDIPYQCLITDVIEAANKIHIVYTVFGKSGLSRNIEQVYLYSGFSYNKLCQIMNLLLEENDTVFQLIGKGCLVMLNHKGQFVNLHVLEKMNVFDEANFDDSDSNSKV